MKKIFLGVSILGLFLSIYADKIDIEKYDVLFQKYGDIYAINPKFIKKIALLESGLDGTRVTPSVNKQDNFVGLFQLSEKFFIIDSKNIDNEDITNKAVKIMRHCLDNKGYSINMINCFNPSYIDEDKKILLSLLKQNIQ